MPLIRFDAVAGRGQEEIKRLLDAAHRALLTAFHVPPRDRYQIYHEHPAHELREPLASILFCGAVDERGEPRRLSRA